MKTSTYVLGSLKLLRFIEIDIFLNQIVVYHGVKMLHFRNERRQGGHVHPPMDKNSEDLVILI